MLRGRDPWLQRLQILHEIDLLRVRQIQVKQLVVVIDHREEIAGAPVVLHIQDIHRNKEAQDNIGGTVLSLLNAEAVGAVETNGQPRVLWKAGADLELQRAIVIAAVALGVFWDPAVVGGAD